MPTHSMSRITAAGNLNAPDAHVYRCLGVRGKDADVDHVDMLKHKETMNGLAHLLQRGRFKRTTLCESKEQAELAAESGSAPLAALGRNGEDSDELWQIRTTGTRELAVADGAGNSTAPVEGGLPGEVPGVTLLGGNELGSMALVPAESGHVVSFEGTAGVERLSIDLDGARSSTVRYLDLEIPDGRRAELRIGASDASELRVDQDGDGAPEKLVAPTAAATGETATDDEPPALKMCPAAGGYTLLAEDERSDVATVMWSEDGRHFKPATGTIVPAPGTTTVHAFADDALANRSGMLRLDVPRDKPQLSIADAEVAEGEDVARFKVRLDCPSPQPVTVTYGTADGTADGGSDFDSAAGRLTFAPGETSATVDVRINHDELDEDEESFQVVLGGPAKATLADRSADGRIADDDETPTISIADASVTESDMGDASHPVKLELSAPSGRAVKVEWATQDGTASAGSDYVEARGTATIRSRQHDGRGSPRERQGRHRAGGGRALLGAAHQRDQRRARRCRGRRVDRRQ